MFYDHDMGWWGFAGMGVGMAVFWAAVLFGVIVAAVYLIGERPSAAPKGHQPTAEDILAGRFARGEIDEAEYRRRIAALRDHAQR